MQRTAGDLYTRRANVSTDRS